MLVADGITPDFGFQGGPTFKTNIVSLNNGREVRNADWSQARHAFTANYGSMSQAQFLYLKDLYLQCRGRWAPFLFRDWSDFQAVDAQFGTGDGTTTTFQLSKTSSLPGGTPYIRTVRAPESGVIVKVAGVVTAASVSQTDGSVVFTAAPASGAALTWSGNYLLQVRFDDDALAATVNPEFDDDGNPCMSGQVKLMEVFD